jgi:hypothetical protein
LQPLTALLHSTMDYIPRSHISQTSTLEVGVLDVRVRRSFTNTQSKTGGGIRSSISELSDASRRRLVERARNTPNITSLLTFTYPGEQYASLGNPFMTSGEHVKYQFTKLRKALVRRGLAGFWFLEFQARGAPHFHVFCVGTLDLDALDSLRALWRKIVGSSCPHHCLTRTSKQSYSYAGIDYQVLRRPDAAGAYAAKYSSKDVQKVVPDHYKGVGRFWGFFGELPDKEVIRLSYREILSLVRVSRAAARAQARSRPGYRARVDKGLTGLAQWYVAPAIRYYLSRVYTVQGSPGGYLVTARRKRNPECSHPPMKPSLVDSRCPF